MIRRINLFAGAGAGKSTLAASLFSSMKKNGKNVELVHEYVKTWAYEHRDVDSFDQVYLFAKQLRSEDILLRKNRTELIITDSPVMLSVCYAEKYGLERWQSLVEIANSFEEEYPSKNFFLNRSDCEYKQDGRFEDYEQAKEMDKKIKQFMYNQNISFVELSYNEEEKFLSLIEGENDV